MTAAEQSQMRDLVARIALLEKENARLRAQLKAERTKRMKAVDGARKLHGILLAWGFKEPTT